MPDTVSDNSNIVAALAVAVCREIYALLGGAIGIWAAVHEVQERLNISRPEIQEALRYARDKGWVEGIGSPMVSVMLQEPSRSLFVGHPTQAKAP